MIKSKADLEKVIKRQKEDILEAEQKATDYYNQLLSTKENFQILHNEQKILSEELTEKQRELQSTERAKLDLERELLQLRPLEKQVEDISENNKAQIESNVHREHQLNKLKRQVLDLQTDKERVVADFDELKSKNLKLT